MLPPEAMSVTIKLSSVMWDPIIPNFQPKAVGVARLSCVWLASGGFAPSIITRNNKALSQAMCVSHVLHIGCNVVPQAMSLNIQLTYSSREEEAAAAAAHRPGVVIGGGYGLPQRGRGGRGGGMRHSHSEGAMAQAVQVGGEVFACLQS